MINTTNLTSLDGEIIDLELEKLDEVKQREKFLDKFQKGVFSKDGIFYDDLDDASRNAVDNYLTNLNLKDSDYHSDKIINKISILQKQIEDM